MPSSTGRSPLEDTTNGYRTPTRTPSPAHATAKRGPILRHKSSQHVLHPFLDSSESYPSSHDSVYEASIVNSSAENINWYDAKDWATPKATGDVALSPLQSDDPKSWSSDQRPSWENTVVDSSGNAVPVSFLEETLSPKKHTPHKLYPITEQTSLATLRAGASQSTLKGHPSATSIRTPSPGLNGKKRKSFSASDLPRKPSPLPIPETPSPPASPQSFYTPIEPHQAPPLRIPTPPGLPTFNEPAASSYRLPPPPTRFRDKFRSPTAAEREWAMQTVGLPRGVVMRGEDGVLIRGKFTPIRSGHFPPQRQAHALFGMPGAGSVNNTFGAASPPRPVVLDQRHVHFTGPRSQPVSTTDEGGVSATVINDNGGKKWRDERAEKLLRKAYWIMGCCGLCEAWDLSNQQVNRGRNGNDNGNVGEMPLFVGGFRAGEQRDVS